MGGMGMNPMMGMGGMGMDPMSMMMMNPMMMGMGGKGMKGGKGKGGKGGFGMMGMWEDHQAKRHPKDKKVYVGGLPTLGSEGLSKELNMKLKEHFKQAGVCSYAEIGRKGVGVACFKEREEATQAITLLNGSVFEGNVLEVKAWGSS